MENKNVKVNTEIDFRVTQSDIIEMLVEDKIKFLTAKIKDFKERALNLGPRNNEHFLSVFKIKFTELKDYKVSAVNSQGKTAEIKYPYIDEKGNVASMYTYIYESHNVAFVNTKTVNDVEITNYIKFIIPNNFDMSEVEALKKEIAEFSLTLPKSLNAAKLAKEIKTEFTRKAVAENKTLQKFLTTKFLR
jgi:hypothetical protein